MSGISTSTRGPTSSRRMSAGCAPRSTRASIASSSRRSAARGTCSVRHSRFLRSTGFRFALLHTLVFVVSVVAIGWVAEFSVTTALERQARQRVETEAATLVLEREREGWQGLRAAIETRLGMREHRLRYAVLDARGGMILGDHLLAAYAAPSGAGAMTRSVSEGSFDQIFVATRPLADGSRLVIADDLKSVEDVEDVLSNAFLIALGLALALGLGAGALLTRALLRRVEAVTRTAEAIIAGDLSQRIALSGSSDDFDRLSSTLNTMLDRIAGLMENLRQVTNDIAHDLRTPLSRLRQGLEDARLRTSGACDCEIAFERAISEADGLLDTFSALLHIAQVESGARRVAFRPVDLSEVVRAVAEAYEPAAEDGGRFLETAITDGLLVQGDRELLVQLFANLVENTLHHTPPGTRIALGVERGGRGEALATVADNGPGIPEGERSRVLQRFYRLERSRTTPGNGLGLSLVAGVVEVHRATLELADNRPGLKVIVRFLEPALLS